MFAIFAVVISFYAVFKQNGSTLNTWANQFTDREVPNLIQPLISGLFLAEKINYEKDSVVLMDKQFRVKDKNLKEWNYPVYFKNIPKY